MDMSLTVREGWMTLSYSGGGTEVDCKEEGGRCLPRGGRGLTSDYQWCSEFLFYLFVKRWHVAPNTKDVWKKGWQNHQGDMGNTRWWVTRPQKYDTCPAMEDGWLTQLHAAAPYPLPSTHSFCQTPYTPVFHTLHSPHPNVNTPLPTPHLIIIIIIKSLFFHAQYRYKQYSWDIK